MSRLILIRHGETDLSGRFCGQMDPDLNARGEEQVRELERMLKNVQMAQVYSSDLLRARRTAETVARVTGAQLQLAPELREISFGDWEGLHWSEIESRFPDEAALWLNEYPHHPAPGGESLRDFEGRVLKVAANILAAESGTVCIVSHGGVMRLLLQHFSGVSDDEAWTLTKEHVTPIAIDAAEVVLR
jgi:alpha-ribazole phosphatase